MKSTVDVTMAPRKKILQRSSTAAWENNINVLNEAALLSGALADPWTDEQQTVLFKSMMSWKPVGASLLLE